MQKAQPEKMIDYRPLIIYAFSLGIYKKDIANAIGMTPENFYRVTNKGLPLDMKQIYAICDFLGIPYSEIPDYFPLVSNIKKRRCTA